MENGILYLNAHYIIFFICYNENISLKPLLNS